MGCYPALDSARTQLRVFYAGLDSPANRNREDEDGQRPRWSAGLHMHLVVC